MRESASDPVIVRTYAPARRVAAVIAVTLLGVFGLYVIYELGRYDAGYDRLAVAQQRAQLEASIGHLKEANHELSLRLAEMDTQRIGWAREQAEVSHTIGDLQAQVARQGQDLAFYRGAGAPSAAAGVGVSIQQLHIGATAAPAHFRVHLTLVRAGRSDDLASGAALLQVEGESQGRAQSIGLPALTAGAQHELRYSFRYFENLEQEITLPEGLHPERLSVELRSSRKGIAPLSQTFMWNVDAS